MSIKIKTTILKPKEMTAESYDNRFWDQSHYGAFNLKNYLKYCLSDYHGLDEILDWVSKAGYRPINYEGDYGYLKRYGKERYGMDNGWKFDFQTKEELLEAIKYHINRHYNKGCSYCSGELQHEITHIILWQEIFYKVPPPGARDLRIVDSTRWANIAHVSYKCSKCGTGRSYWTSYRDLERAPEKPKKGLCFIATVIYDSPIVHELYLLRDFRDNTLLKNPLISWTVKLYYRISPSIAEDIEKDEDAKKKLRSVIDISVKLIEKRNNVSNSFYRGLYSSLAFFVYVYGFAYAKFIARKSKPEKEDGFGR